MIRAGVRSLARSWEASLLVSYRTGAWPRSRRKSELEPRTQNELKRKKLAPTSRFLVLVCRVQLFAKHFSCPVRYRLCGFTQFAADEVPHYPEAAAMRCVVVHEQFIGTFGDFGEILG